LPSALPGVFMRASLPSESTSCAGTIATRAGEASARPISSHAGSSLETPAAAAAR
jgi:hypothetical protein